MVIRTLHKKLLRTVMRTRGQSLAVVMVVACGIACYICMNTTYLNLKLTRDTYYAEHRLADFEIMLERAPNSALFKVEEIPGVRQARGRMVEDVSVDIQGISEARIGRIISMPSPRRPVMNDLQVLAGRYFEPGAQDEVILSQKFAESNALAIGDRIEATIKQKKHSLRIIGLGLSPEYVYMIRNAQEMLPAPEKFGIMWVPEDFAESALDMKEACNNIVGRVDDPAQLDEILDRAKKVLDPYGVFAKVKGEDQISSRYLADEIQGLAVSATIMPTIFLGIAAMILLVVLNRLVRTERPFIGLLKAYGYSHATVALHYIQYALILGIVGCVLGFGLGQWLASGMIKIYVEFYQFPVLLSRVHPEVLARAMAIAMAAATVGALMAALRAARIQPAEAMRPEPPRSARRIWLERYQALWGCFNFTGKMIVRNISRNRFRAGLTIFGTMVSTGLLISGFFGMDAMYFAIDFQYRDVHREDVKVAFQTERGKDTYFELKQLDHVRYVEPLLEYPFEMASEWRNKDILIVGIPEDAELFRLKTFAGEDVPIPESGLVVSDKLARILGVGPGDRVTVKPLVGRVKKTVALTVRKVTQQFLGMNAYMDHEALSRILDEPFVMSSALLRIDAGAEDALSRDLKDVAGIASVSYSKDAYQALLDTLAASMNISNMIMIAFAGVISISIIYNVTAVALAERQRELASLRVLGLSPAEVGSILYCENFFLGVLGVILGVPFGITLSMWLVQAYDTELYRIPFHIETRTYIFSVVFVLTFVLLANLTVRRKIHSLDLVEALKAHE